LTTSTVAGVSRTLKPKRLALVAVALPLSGLATEVVGDSWLVLALRMGGAEGVGRPRLRAVLGCFGSRPLTLICGSLLWLLIGCPLGGAV
jgi:hypothetical protein